MSLVIEVKRALADFPPYADLPREIDVSHGGQRLVCELTAIDSLACGFSRFSVESAALAGAGVERLKRVGAELARRLNYLLEPIAVLEIDPLAATVQLRSDPPARDPEAIRYYELVVESQGRLTLRRYLRTPGEPRQPAPAQVTREVFIRLASDFVAAME